MADLKAGLTSGLVCATTDEAMQAALGQLMKYVSFAAQRELEKAVREAFASGTLQGGEVLTMG
jgi:Family of unknown function (DUF6494)